MDISLGRRFLLTSVKYGIPTYLSLPSLKVSCPNPPPQMSNSRKPLKKSGSLGGGYHIYIHIYIYHALENVIAIIQVASDKQIHFIKSGADMLRLYTALENSCAPHHFK